MRFYSISIFFEKFLNFYNDSNLNTKNTNKHLNVCWHLVIILLYTCLLNRAGQFHMHVSKRIPSIQIFSNYICRV